MYEKLAPLAALVAVGMWLARRPSWRDGAARGVVAALVIGLFAPGLVADVVLRATLSGALASILTTGLVTVTACAAAGWIVHRLWGRAFRAAQAGALVLAVTFGNGMGMGLPVVEALVGPTQTHVPLAYDLLVTVPLVWTAGVVVAARCGGMQRGALGGELLRLPPFLALVGALLWRAAGIPVPDWVLTTTALTGRAAVPLMALLVGLAVRWPGAGVPLHWVGAAVVARVVLAPGVALGVALWLGMDPDTRAAVVLTAGAPSVIVGAALCERYRLDVGLFGAVLAISTAAYLLLAPGWAHVARGL